jgi:hypothetical protein
VNTGVSKIHLGNHYPSEGVGLGRHIEESVQNSTGENLDPYGSRGGNDTVDRGKYTEITWSSAAGDVSPGWAPHEMLGYGDANTDKIRKRNVLCIHERSICSSSNRDFIKIGNRGNTSISQTF